MILGWVITSWTYSMFMEHNQYIIFFRYIQVNILNRSHFEEKKPSFLTEINFTKKRYIKAKKKIIHHYDALDYFGII